MRVRGIVFSALFAALFAVLSLVQFHIGVIPITLETLIVMLTGAVLGPWYGALTYLIVIAFDVIGLPLIGGSAGVHVLLGPTAGYIWAWPFCAFFTGVCARMIPHRSRFEYILLVIVMFVLGDLISYIPGVLWIRHVVPPLHPWGKALMTGAIPFIPGDFVKSLIAALIVVKVRDVYPEHRIIYGDGFVDGSKEQGSA